MAPAPHGGILVLRTQRQGFDRGRADSPERDHASSPNPFALVAEQRDQVGNGRCRVGPDSPQAHDDLGSHAFLLSFSRPSKPSTAGLPMAASARAER